MTEPVAAFVFLIFTFLPEPSLRQSPPFEDLILCERAASAARHYWGGSAIAIPTLNADGGACVPVPACPR